MREDLLHLLGNLDDHDALNAALVRFVVRDTIGADKSFGTLLRSSAIPRVLNPEIIGVLQETPEDVTANRAALVRLSGYPFIAPLSEGREEYTMHEAARAAILSDWREDAERSTYQALNRSLAAYFESIEEPLEALYHSFVFAPSDAFEEFRRLFKEALVSYRRSEAESLLATARDQQVELHPEKRLWLTCYQAHLAAKLHRWMEARDILQELLSKELPPGLEARSLYDLGLISDKIGMWEEAEHTLETALAKWRGIGDKYNTAVTLNYLGVVKNQRGKWHEGLSAYEDAIGIFDELKQYADVAGTRCNLALAYQKRGEWGKALKVYEQAREGFRDAGEQYNEARVSSNLGFLYSLRGQPKTAIVLLQQAIAIFHRLGDDRAEAAAQDNLGIAYRKLGRIDQALGTHQQALEIFQRLDHRYGVAQVLSNQGDAFMERGQWNEAESAYTQALTMFGDLGDPYGQAVTQGRIGEWHVRQGHWMEGLQILEHCLETLRGLLSYVDAAHVLFWMGKRHQGQAQWKEAATCYQNALEILPVDSDWILMARIQHTMAELAAQQGYSVQFVKHLRRAIQFWETSTRNTEEQQWKKT